MAEAGLTETPSCLTGYCTTSTHPICIREEDGHARGTQCPICGCFTEWAGGPRCTEVRTTGIGCSILGHDQGSSYESAQVSKRDMKRQQDLFCVSVQPNSFSVYVSGYKTIMHGGGIVEYQTKVAFFPEMGFGFYMTCNGPVKPDPPALQLISLYISDLLLGEEPWLSPETGCTFPEPWFTRWE